MQKEENKKHLYECWLAVLSGLSDRKKILLRAHMKSAEAVYYIEETDLQGMKFLNEQERNTIMQAGRETPEEKYEILRKKRIQVITYFEKDYPKRLLEIPDPPYALYYKGNLPQEPLFSAAIVGARNCTPYGEKYAYEFAEQMARCQIQIISGLAKGIDGAGQRGALTGKGQTFAVLGCGVDICYPREHIGLYSDILVAGGGILSEFPPGTEPRPYHFPRRNRVISGLSDVVLVMEARKKSGSLITADLALEQGKDVYALPGPVDSALSEGCNRLIRQGAGILLSPKEFLEDLGVLTKEQTSENLVKFIPGQEEKKKMLESRENLVYSSLCLYPKSLNQIVEDTCLSAREVVCSLVSLEMQGLAEEISKNFYIRK